MNNRDQQNALSVPFPSKDVEFRISRISQKNRKACVVAYINARAIMERLDSVFGIGGWKDEYDVLRDGVKCRLSARIGDDWIAKEDVAPFTSIEALKGAFSDSLKRAGVKFGIGRYLYDVPEYWVPVSEERPKDTLLPAHYLSSEGLTGWWIQPQLPDWALPDERAMMPSEHLSQLESLKADGLLTKPKYEQYLQSLSDARLDESKKALIWEQFRLIRLWGDRIAHNAEIGSETKKSSYRSIIGSNSSNLASVSEELRRIAEGETDEAAA